MFARKRSGFTLVELLVVVVIISMLVALLVPAVVAARKAAQLADCTNRQAQLSKAVLQYEMNKQQFPGYLNKFGTNATAMNWIVVCLPYLGREDLWKEWRDNGANKLVQLDQLTCPGDTPPGSYPLSYVANCGKAGATGAAYGVFHDHYNVSPPSNWAVVSASSIPDGAQATILLSENVQAGEWNSTAQTSIGILWKDSAGSCGRVNRCLDATVSQPIPVDYARPSSRHGGGAVFSFCDGHQRFITEDVAYNVYKHLMTPDSQSAGLTGTVGTDAY